jgi:tRNA(Ile)-lysidine synthase
MKSSSAEIPDFESAVATGLGTWTARTVFLAAVSGGVDSTAMLAALAALRQKGNYELRCLHVEHGIRPLEESWGDALAVKDICKRLDVPCGIISIPAGKIAETAKRQGLGIEGAARWFRHGAWNQEARRIRAKRILVAHTQDDLLETLLMRLLRGSGPTGLATMPQERGRILRPLLGLTRTEALNYLSAKGIPFRTDATNEDIRYLRNRIRHKLVPCLDDLFPYWRKTLLAMAETQGLTAAFVKSEVQNRVQWEWEAKGYTLYTQGERFFSQPLIIREEGLFQGVDMMTPGVRKRGETAALDFAPDSTRENLGEAIPRVPRRSVLRLFAQGKTPGIDAGPIRIERQGNLITLSSSTGKAYTCYDEGFALLIKAPGVYTLKGLRIECKAPSAEDRLESAPRPLDRGEEERFFARLPLVFKPFYRDICSMKGLDRLGYSEYTRSIMAEDRKGPVACIFLDKKDKMMVLCREETGVEGAVFFSFIISFGGIDV